MKQSYGRSLRLISAILIVSFLCQELAHAAPDLHPLDLTFNIEKKDFLKQAKKELSFIPESVATIEDAWKAPSMSSSQSSSLSPPQSLIGDQTFDPRLKIAGVTSGGDNLLVYLIQDAHTNDSGQLNLSKTLDLLLQKDNVIARSPQATKQSMLTPIAEIASPAKSRGLAMTPIKYVFSEAGVDNNSLSQYRGPKPFKERKQIADEYLKKGLLHGTEYLDLTSNHNFILWGVEDPALYVKAFKDYKAVAQDRPRFDLYLKKIESTISTLKDRLLNPSLLSFDKERQKYEKEELTLTSYFDVLQREAYLRNIPLSKYPHLDILKSLKDKEQQIDFKLANEEQAKAIQSLSPEDQKELLNSQRLETSRLNSKDHREIEGFYALLEEKLTANLSSPQSLSGDPNMPGSPIKAFGDDKVHIHHDTLYPNLFKYFDYLKLSKFLESKPTLEELKSLEKDILDHLITNEDERMLLKASKAVYYLRKLFYLSMTPEDYREYKELTAKLSSPQSLSGDQTFDPRSKTSGVTENVDKYPFTIEYLTGFLNKKIMDLGTYYERSLFLEPGFEEIVQRAEDFYDLTLKRDEAFIENMMKKLGDDRFQLSSPKSHPLSSPKSLIGDQTFGPRSKTSGATKSVVLITGGFHTTNLKSLLKQQGISYVSITPQVLKETNQKRYESILLNVSSTETTNSLKGMLNTLNATMGTRLAMTEKLGLLPLPGETIPNVSLKADLGPGPVSNKKKSAARLAKVGGEVQIITGHRKELDSEAPGGIVEFDRPDSVQNVVGLIELLLKPIKPKVLDRIRTGKILLQGPGYSTYEILALNQLFPKAEIYVADINFNNLSFIRKELNKNKQLQNKSRIKLMHTRFDKLIGYNEKPIEDSFFDFGFSSNLINSTTGETVRGDILDFSSKVLPSWIREIRRTLKTGGVYIVDLADMNLLLEGDLFLRAPDNDYPYPHGLDRAIFTKNPFVFKQPRSLFIIPPDPFLALRSVQDKLYDDKFDPKTRFESDNWADVNFDFDSSLEEACKVFDLEDLKHKLPELVDHLKALDAKLFSLEITDLENFIKRIKAIDVQMNKKRGKSKFASAARLATRREFIQKGIRITLTLFPAFLTFEKTLAQTDTDGVKRLFSPLSEEEFNAIKNHPLRPGRSPLFSPDMTYVQYLQSQKTHSLTADKMTAILKTIVRDPKMKKLEDILKQVPAKVVFSEKISGYAESLENFPVVVLNPVKFGNFNAFHKPLTWLTGFYIGHELLHIRHHEWNEYKVFVESLKLAFPIQSNFQTEYNRYRFLIDVARSLSKHAQTARDYIDSKPRVISNPKAVEDLFLPLNDAYQFLLKNHFVSNRDEIIYQRYQIIGATHVVTLRVGKNSYKVQLIENVQTSGVPSRGARLAELNTNFYRFTQNPVGSKVINLPFSFLAVSSLITLASVGMTCAGYGGWILTTIIPFVFLGGYMLVFKKSWSPASNILLELMVAWYTVPFLLIQNLLSNLVDEANQYRARFGKNGNQKNFQGARLAGAYSVRNPVSSRVISLPVMVFGEKEFRTLWRIGVMISGLGGWILETIIPLVFLAGNNAELRKSLSADTSARRVSIAILYTEPFLTLFGVMITSWPFLLKKWAISIWRSSSTRNRNFGLGNGMEFFVFYAPSRILKSGLNGFFGKGGESTQNFLFGHSTSQKFQDSGNVHATSPKDGTSMTPGSIDNNFAFNRFHFFIPSEKNYSTIIHNVQNSLLAVSAARLTNTLTIIQNSVEELNGKLTGPPIILYIEDSLEAQLDMFAVINSGFSGYQLITVRNRVLADEVLEEISKKSGQLKLIMTYGKYYSDRENNILDSREGFKFIKNLKDNQSDFSEIPVILVSSDKFWEAKLQEIDRPNTYFLWKAENTKVYLKKIREALKILFTRISIGGRELVLTIENRSPTTAIGLEDTKGHEYYSAEVTLTDGVFPEKVFEIFKDALTDAHVKGTFIIAGKRREDVNESFLKLLKSIQEINQVTSAARLAKNPPASSNLSPKGELGPGPVSKLDLLVDLFEKHPEGILRMWDQWIEDRNSAARLAENSLDREVKSMVIDGGAKVFKEAQPKEAGNVNYVWDVVNDHEHIRNGYVVNRDSLNPNQRNMDSAVRRDDWHLSQRFGNAVSEFFNGRAVDHRIRGSGVQNHVDLHDSQGAGEVNFTDDNSGRFFGKFDFQRILKRIEQFFGNNAPVKVIYTLFRTFFKSNFLDKARRVFPWYNTSPSSLASFVYSKASHWFLNFLLAASNFINNLFPNFKNNIKVKYEANGYTSKYTIPKLVPTNDAAIAARLAEKITMRAGGKSTEIFSPPDGLPDSLAIMTFLTDQAKIDPAFIKSISVFNAPGQSQLFLPPYTISIKTIPDIQTINVTLHPGFEPQWAPPPAATLSIKDLGFLGKDLGLIQMFRGEVGTRINTKKIAKSANAEIYKRLLQALVSHGFSNVQIGKILKISNTAVIRLRDKLNIQSPQNASPTEDNELNSDLIREGEKQEDSALSPTGELGPGPVFGARVASTLHNLKIDLGSERAQTRRNAIDTLRDMLSTLNISEEDIFWLIRMFTQEDEESVRQPFLSLLQQLLKPLISSGKELPSIFNKQIVLEMVGKKASEAKLTEPDVVKVLVKARVNLSKKNNLQLGSNFLYEILDIIRERVEKDYEALIKQARAESGWSGQGATQSFSLQGLIPPYTDPQKVLSRLEALKNEGDPIRIEYFVNTELAQMAKITPRRTQMTGTLQKIEYDESTSQIKIFWKDETEPTVINFSTAYIDSIEKSRWLDGEQVYEFFQTTPRTEYVIIYYIGQVRHVISGNLDKVKSLDSSEILHNKVEWRSPHVLRIYKKHGRSFYDDLDFNKIKIERILMSGARVGEQTAIKSAILKSLMAIFLFQPLGLSISSRAQSQNTSKTKNVSPALAEMEGRIDQLQKELDALDWKKNSKKFVEKISEKMKNESTKGKQFADKGLLKIEQLTAYVGRLSLMRRNNFEEDQRELKKIKDRLEAIYQEVHLIYRRNQIADVHDPRSEAFGRAEDKFNKLFLKVKELHFEAAQFPDSLFGLPKANEEGIVTLIAGKDSVITLRVFGLGQDQRFLQEEWFVVRKFSGIRDLWGGFSLQVLHRIKIIGVDSQNHHVLESEIEKRIDGNDALEIYRQSTKLVTIPSRSGARTANQQSPDAIVQGARVAYHPFFSKLRLIQWYFFFLHTLTHLTLAYQFGQILQYILNIPFIFVFGFIAWLGAVNYLPYRMVQWIKSLEKTSQSDVRIEEINHKSAARFATWPTFKQQLRAWSLSAILAWTPLLGLASGKAQTKSIKKEKPVAVQIKESFGPSPSFGSSLTSVNPQTNGAEKGKPAVQVKEPKWLQQWKDKTSKQPDYKKMSLADKAQLFQFIRQIINLPFSKEAPFIIGLEMPDGKIVSNDGDIHIAVELEENIGRKLFLDIKLQDTEKTKFPEEMPKIVEEIKKGFLISDYSFVFAGLLENKNLIMLIRSNSHPKNWMLFNGIKWEEKKDVSGTDPRAVLDEIFPHDKNKSIQPLLIQRNRPGARLSASALQHLQQTVLKPNEQGIEDVLRQSIDSSLIYLVLLTEIAYASHENHEIAQRLSKFLSHFSFHDQFRGPLTELSSYISYIVSDPASFKVGFSEDGQLFYCSVPHLTQFIPFQGDFEQADLEKYLYRLLFEDNAEFLLNSVRSAAKDPSIDLENLQFPVKTIRIQAGSTQEVYLVQVPVTGRGLISFVVSLSRKVGAAQTVKKEFQNLKAHEGGPQLIRVFDLKVIQSSQGQVAAYSSEYLDDSAEVQYKTTYHAARRMEPEGIFRVESHIPVFSGVLSLTDIRQVVGYYAGLLTKYYDHSSQTMIKDFSALAGDLNVRHSVYVGRNGQFNLLPVLNDEVQDTSNVRLVAWRETAHGVTPPLFLDYLFSLDFIDGSKGKWVIKKPIESILIQAGIFDGLLKGMVKKYGINEGRNLLASWIRQYLDELEKNALIEHDLFDKVSLNNFYRLLTEQDHEPTFIPAVDLVSAARLATPSGTEVKKLPLGNRIFSLSSLFVFIGAAMGWLQSYRNIVSDEHDFYWNFLNAVPNFLLVWMTIQLAMLFSKQSIKKSHQAALLIFASAEIAMFLFRQGLLWMSDNSLDFPLYLQRDTFLNLAASYLAYALSLRTHEALYRLSTGDPKKDARVIKLPISKGARVSPSGYRMPIPSFVKPSQVAFRTQTHGSSYISERFPNWKPFADLKKWRTFLKGKGISTQGIVLKASMSDAAKAEIADKMLDLIETRQSSSEDPDIRAIKKKILKEYFLYQLANDVLLQNDPKMQVYLFDRVFSISPIGSNTVSDFDRWDERYAHLLRWLEIINKISKSLPEQSILPATIPDVRNSLTNVSLKDLLGLHGALEEIEWKKIKISFNKFLSYTRAWLKYQEEKDQILQGGDKNDIFLLISELPDNIFRDIYRHRAIDLLQALSVVKGRELRSVLQEWKDLTKEIKDPLQKKTSRRKWVVRPAAARIAKNGKLLEIFSLGATAFNVVLVEVWPRVRPLANTFFLALGLGLAIGGIAASSANKPAETPKAKSKGATAARLANQSIYIQSSDEIKTLESGQPTILIIEDYFSTLKSLLDIFKEEARIEGYRIIGVPRRFLAEEIIKKIPTDLQLILTDNDSSLTSDFQEKTGIDFVRDLKTNFPSMTIPVYVYNNLDLSLNLNVLGRNETYFLKQKDLHSFITEEVAGILEKNNQHVSAARVTDVANRSLGTNKRRTTQDQKRKRIEAGVHARKDQPIFKKEELIVPFSEIVFKEDFFLTIEADNVRELVKIRQNQSRDYEIIGFFPGDDTALALEAAQNGADVVFLMGNDYEKRQLTIQRLHDEHPEVKISLEVRVEANESTDSILQKIHWAQDHGADEVLIKPYRQWVQDSKTTGHWEQWMDPQTLKELSLKIYEEDPDFILGIAGGVTEENVKEVLSLSAGNLVAFVVAKDDTLEAFSQRIKSYKTAIYPPLGARTAAIENLIAPTQSILDELAEQQPIPENYDLLWGLNSDSLRVPVALAEIYKQHPTKIIITGGVGTGTRTLNFLKQANDLTDPSTATKIFQNVDLILDQLAELKNSSGENSLWKEVDKRFHIQVGLDRQKLASGMIFKSRFKISDTGVKLWNHMYEGVFSETELAAEPIEKLVLRRLLDRKTRYDTKIPEGIIYYAALTALGVRPEDIVVDAQSTTSVENVEFGIKLLKENGWSHQVIVLMQQPFIQRRGRLSFQKQARNFGLDYDHLVSHAAYRYQNQDAIMAMSPVRIQELARRAIDEVEKLALRPLPSWTTIDAEPISEELMRNYRLLNGFLVDANREADYRRDGQAGFNTAYDAHTLKSVLERPIRQDQPEASLSLVSTVPEDPLGQDLRKNITTFVNRLKQTKAAKNWKVIFNLEEAKDEFSDIHMTWLRSTAVQSLGEQASKKIRQVTSETGDVNVTIKGSNINHRNGRVSLYGYDSYDAILDFRKEVLKGSGNEKYPPVVHIGIATVIEPLTEEEREEWLRILREYEDYVFGAIVISKVLLVEHRNDFLKGVVIKEEFPLGLSRSGSRTARRAARFVQTRQKDISEAQQREHSQQHREKKFWRDVQGRFSRKDTEAFLRNLLYVEKLIRQEPIKSKKQMIMALYVDYLPVFDGNFLKQIKEKLWNESLHENLYLNASQFLLNEARIHRSKSRVFIKKVEKLRDIFDDPFNGLDPTIRKWYLDDFRVQAREPLAKVAVVVPLENQTEPAAARLAVSKARLLEILRRQRTFSGEVISYENKDSRNPVYVRAILTKNGYLVTVEVYTSDDFHNRQIEAGILRVRKWPLDTIELRVLDVKTLFEIVEPIFDPDDVSYDVEEVSTKVDLEGILDLLVNFIEIDPEKALKALNHLLDHREVGSRLATERTQFKDLKLAVFNSISPTHEGPVSESALKQAVSYKALHEIAQANQTLLTQHQILPVLDVHTVLLLGLQIEQVGKTSYLVVDKDRRTFRRIDLKAQPRDQKDKIKTQLEIITEMNIQTLDTRTDLMSVTLNPLKKGFLQVGLSAFDLNNTSYNFDILSAQLVSYSKTPKGKGMRVQFLGSSTQVQQAAKRLLYLQAQYGLDTEIFVTQAPEDPNYETVNLLDPHEIHPTNTYNLPWSDLEKGKRPNYTPSIDLANTIARSSSDPSKNTSILHAFERLVGHEVPPAIFSGILAGTASLQVLLDNTIKPSLSAWLENGMQFYRAVLSLVRSA